MISGAHVILYSTDAEADRAFFRDVLKFRNVDAGDGWLIFTLPPSEVAVHPSKENGSHELYLMCDDIDATRRTLRRRKVRVTAPVERGWGRVATVTLPGGSRIGVYQPSHSRAPKWKRPSR
jgi:catechol 2,3-dioxygenase-like lactoylglutathione lyase family enzyme